MMRFVLHIALILVSAQLYAQEVSSKFTSDETLIGNPVSLMYKIESAEPLEDVQFTPFETVVMGNSMSKAPEKQKQIELEIIGAVSDTTYENEGMYYWEQHYQLTAWDSALIMLPPKEVLIADSLFSFPAAFFNFTYPSADDQNSFYDINELFSDVEPTSENIFLSLVKSVWFWVALVLIAFVVIYIIKKKKRSIENEPMLPPEEVAWLAIKELEDSDLYAKDLKEFYVQLSLILRRFLTRHYNMRLMDKTSTELIAVLKSKQLSSTTQQLTRTVLIQSDLVKFAKSTPPITEVLEMTSKTRTIIDDVLDKSKSILDE